MRFRKGIFCGRALSLADTPLCNKVRSLELVYLQNIDVDALFAVPLEKLQRGMQKFLGRSVREIESERSAKRAAVGRENTANRIKPGTDGRRQASDHPP
jgi:hypothetical protein